MAAAGSTGPTKVSLRLASLAAAAGLIVVFAAFVVTGHPWWAAVAMAAVAILTSAVATAGPAGAVLGMLGGIGFVLTVVCAATVGLVPDVSVLSGASRVVLGAVGGLVVATVGAMVRNRRAGTSTGPDIPAPWGPMWASLRSFDEHTRDGVRRAIPLAIGMFVYQRTLDHDSLWIFIAAFAVLLPTGKPTVGVAATRVVSTIVGMLVLSVLGLVSAAGVLFTAAILFLLVGIAYKPTYPLPAAALSAMGAVLLVAGPAGDLGAWAAHRLLDTLLGCAMALASMYLLWPRDKPDNDAVTAE
ncbi:FUSC family protein [Pseudonocardia sp. T1-2H]|uniref:FUSC family protein n=1 Tax=Pseudonocardia sp. T1-2H TaxID=3128899 RepID=UPI0031014918